MARTPFRVTDMRVLGALAPQTGDVTPPTIPQNLVATAINAGRIDLSWTASTDDFGVSGYQIFRNGSPLNTTSVTTYSDTTCQPSTAYSYVIVAFDGAGNSSAPSNASNATTPANATPVWQTIPTQTLIVGNAYLLQLTDYCTDADLDTLTFAITSGTLPTGLALSGNRIQGTPTVAGETPTIAVRAADAFHQISTTIVYSTKTADVTAPPVPTGLAAVSISSSQINISWNASTDVAGGANEFVSGTKDYRVYRDGVLRTTQTGTTYSDTGLSAGTQYSYRVSARDNTLNESAQATQVSATTAASIYSPSFPRLGSYALAGTQRYDLDAYIDAAAKRHVNIVTHYPGWQNSKTRTMAQVASEVKLRSVIGSKFYTYVLYESIRKDQAPIGNANWELWQQAANNHQFAYTDGVAETGPVDSNPTNYAKCNYTTAAKLVAGKRWHEFAIDWSTRLNRDGGAISNGSTTFTAAVNPNLDGMYLDNWFYRERQVADYDRDGTLDDITSAGSRLLIQNSHAAASTYYRTVWPGSSLIVNAADWYQQKVNLGLTITGSPLDQIVEGGIIEAPLGKSYSAETTNNFSNAIDAISVAINAFRNPKLGVVTCDIGSLTNYQMMRYGLGMSLLTDAYYYPHVSGYASEDLPNLWFDEFNFNLGAATDPVQTAPRYLAVGSTGEGVWRRDFQNGIVIVGARRSSGNIATNGDQTTPYASVSLGGTFYRLTGTQAPTVNSGAAITTIAIAPRDAVVLSRTSASVSHGSSVTVTGTGFGSMPTFFFAGGSAGVLETTSIGATPNSGNNVSGPSSALGFNWTRFATLATVVNDATRGRCIGLTLSGTGESCHEVTYSTGVGFVGKIMVKYWARYAFTDSGSGPAPQYKFARLQGGLSDISDTQHNMVFTTLNGGRMAYANSAGGSGSDTWYLGTGTNLPRVNGQWERIEKKIVTNSSQGAADGKVYYRASQNNVPSYVSATSSGSGRQLQSQVVSYQDTSRFTAYTWQNWIGNGLINPNWAIDDHYVQVGSFKCVELWNSLTAASATVREIQEPTSWSDTSITVRLNAGGLPPGTYYLVVLDDQLTDVVLASRQVTLT